MEIKIEEEQIITTTTTTLITKENENESLCRVCLKKSEDIVTITDSFDPNIQDFTIKDVLKYCFKLEVFDNKYI